MSDLVLASGSPRRRAFLTGAGVAHQVRPVDLDESQRPGEDPEAYGLRLAAEKAEVAWSRRAPEVGWVLAADTVVVLDGRVLGKPSDPGEASQMLAALSGRTHSVLTAWALRGQAGRVVHAVARAEVTFEALEASAIAAYVASGDPLDKAGAYGIQGAAGRFVARVVGDYPAVVGLPIEAVLEALERFGVVSALGPVARRLRGVQGRLAAAVDGLGPGARPVRLVGVSKRQAPERIAQAVAAGLRDLGENYVQEWQAKAAACPAGVRWHLIGRLQRNKVRALDAQVALVHGVDSVRTAAALAERGRSLGKPFSFLAQVNLASEPGKGGLAQGELAAFIEEVAGLEGARLEGLMAIPPPAAQAGARRYFARLRALRDAHRRPGLELPELSMGMSGDYEAAVAEGASLVRVGTAIFGEREVSGAGALAAPQG